VSVDPVEPQDASESVLDELLLLLELTEAAYRVAVRHGFTGSLVELHSGLLAALRDAPAGRRTTEASPARLQSPGRVEREAAPAPAPLRFESPVARAVRADGDLAAQA
jgi:hypothetical protein